MLQHTMKHVYYPSALKGRAAASPTFPVTYIVCICPYTYTLLRRHTFSRAVGKLPCHRRLFPLQVLSCGWVQTTHLIHALLNDHYSLHTVHMQAHASMQAQGNCQHLLKGVAGMNMLHPTSLASQRSLVLAKQWMAISIPITAHATAPVRPQGFLGLDCQIKQSQTDPGNCCCQDIPQSITTVSKAYFVILLAVVEFSLLSSTSRFLGCSSGGLGSEAVFFSHFQFEEERHRTMPTSGVLFFLVHQRKTQWL